MQIFLGSDHGGFELKTQLFGYLSTNPDYQVADAGDTTPDPKDDYPQFAVAACVKLLGSSEADPRAILLCRGGQGMAMAANRLHGIRAAVCWNVQSAQMSRVDNNSNVLCLPADSLVLADAKQITDVWLSTKFSGAARHQRRIQELDDL